MAKALQCTSCGATTRIDALADGATFQCETCGQVMKVPPGLAGRGSGGRSPAPAAAGAAAASSSGAPAPAVAPADAPPAPVVAPPDAPPAPRRRSRSTAAGAAAATGAAVGGGTAVLTPGDPAAPGPAPAPPAPSRSERRATRSGGAPRDDRREALPLWMRILIWVIALPIALAIVGIPARQLGYLTSQKLLDVIVKTDLSRFVPILVIIVLWALVTAVLVTVFIEGGRRLMLRRRARATEKHEMSALDSSSEKRGLFGRRKK